MKKLCMQMIIALITCVSSGAGAQGNSGDVREFDVNGLKVLVKPISANAIVSVQLFLRGGCMNLTESTQGIEELVFLSAVKGSTKYPKDTLNAMLDRTASAINSTSTKDFSVVSLRCLKPDLDRLWDVYADVIMHPAFIPTDVQVVRDNMVLGIRQRKDTPDSYLNMVAEEVFYAGHPYRFEPGGVESSVSTITIGQMKEFLHNHLETSRLLLVVVGNVTADDVRKKVEATFGTLPRGTYQPVLPQPVVHTKPSLKIVEKQIPTNYFQGSFSLPRPSDPEYYAAQVMMSVLSTRVWEEVRTKRNLSYAPGAGQAGRLANQGFLYVSTVYPDSAVRVMFGELKKLRDEPVSAKDLKDRIMMYLTHYYLGRETNEIQGQVLAWYEVAGLGWQAAAQSVDRVRGVTAADIQSVARKYLHNLQATVIGDPKLVHSEAYTN